ncbi:uncharacterized protein EV154DRAFT_415255 [Mucor mucedo]|uniref:uncharacterized protein n=1 Tax=Mucor mucedo TaxID=29922 RepID=UPI0022201A11|nr:uncharacterized protein EV154DRAFT_415255 [Mucor mucedo]KAI7894468.1 hypothetical protein EV154DRAFT_415255 [Mucor mucedo]
MSDQTYQSSIDWKASSDQLARPTKIKTAYPVSTITYTDYITSTINGLQPTSNAYEATSYAEDLWEHRIHRFLPVILAFAIIGILTVLGSLVYLAYRFYQANRSSRLRRRRPDSRTARRPSAAPSWLTKILPNKFRSTPRHMSLPILNNRPTIDNLNVPISSTFKPIDKSFLTLVPRSEIWLDPNRRRGVDELDIWERKKSGTIVVPEEVLPAPLMWRFPSASAYPDSPDSVDRGFAAGGSNRRSIHIESRRSSTTMQETLHKNTASCGKSEVS